MAETTPQIPTGGTLLSQLGLSAEEVLQAPNVESTILAPAPPVSDALGIFRSQEEAFGIPTLTSAYQTAQQRRISGEQLAKQEQLTIEGRAKKLGVLRGEQQQAGQQAALDINTLLQGEDMARQALNTAQGRAQQAGELLYNEYQTKVNLQLQFPGLKINPLTDSFGKISGELQSYQKEAKKEAEKDAYKSALRDLGMKTSGSRKELEKRLRKANKDSYERAKKQSDLSIRASELSIQQAIKSLNKPSEEEVLSNLWGDNTVPVNENTGVDGLFDSVYKFNQNMG